MNPDITQLRLSDITSNLLPQHVQTIESVKQTIRYRTQVREGKIPLIQFVRILPEQLEESIMELLWENMEDATARQALVLVNE
jgi:hypothetical protein